MDGNEHLRQCTFAESFKLNEYDGVGYSLGGGGVLYEFLSGDVPLGPWNP